MNDKELKQKFKDFGQHQLDKKILALFVGQKQLNLTQLLVGYYRKYNEIKTRQYMMMTCYRMKKKGILLPTKNKGEYTPNDR